MKKKFLVLLFVAICMISIFSYGCASNYTNTAYNAPKNSSSYIEFEYIESFGEDMSVYREVSTDVLYVYKHRGYGGGFTVMMDPRTRGPLTYTNWKNNYK